MRLLDDILTDVSIKSSPLCGYHAYKYSEHNSRLNSCLLKRIMQRSSIEPRSGDLFITKQLWIYWQYIITFTLTSLIFAAIFYSVLYEE